MVGENRLGDEGTTILCEALRESTVSKVEELDLSRNDIGPKGAKAIAALCAARGSLTSISLFGNDFDDESVATLLKVKEEKPTLVTLCGLTLDQTEANFTGWNLAPADAKLLAPEMLVHGSLTKIS